MNLGIIQPKDDKKLVVFISLTPTSGKGIEHHLSQ